MLYVPGLVPRLALDQGRRKEAKGRGRSLSDQNAHKDPENPSGSILGPAQLRQGNSSARPPREEGTGMDSPSYLGSHRADAELRARPAG